MIWKLRDGYFCGSGRYIVDFESGPVKSDATTSNVVLEVDENGRFTAPAKPAVPLYAFAQIVD